MTITETVGTAMTRDPIGQHVAERSVAWMKRVTIPGTPGS